MIRRIAWMAALAALGCSEFSITKDEPEVTAPRETGTPPTDPTDVTETELDTADTAVTDTVVVVETGDTDTDTEVDTEPPPTGDARTRGRVFWTGFMENLDLAFNGPPKFAIVVRTDVDSAGEVQVPVTGLTVPFTTTAGVPLEVELPAATWYPETSETVSDKGIRVITDDDATVHVVHYRLYFSDASVVLPEPELDDAYAVMAVRDGDGAYPSEFLVVATQPDTEVEITPSGLTDGLRPAGVPFTVTLQAGQSYMVQSREDLTGSVVRALGGEPLAVYGGSQQAEITCGPDSHVMDQNLPLSRWGQEYAVVPFRSQGGDPVRVLAAEDDTEVRVNCGAPTTLAAGQWLDLTASSPTHIAASKPVGVAQHNKGQDCNASHVGDPSFLVHAPLALTDGTLAWDALNDATFQAPKRHAVNVLTDGSTLFFDGSDVSGDLQPFPGVTGWSYASFDVPGGAHELTGDGRLSATAYGFSQYDAYTYVVSYDCVGCVEQLTVEPACK
jgi:hypothetical protein